MIIKLKYSQTVPPDAVVFGLGFGLLDSSSLIGNLKASLALSAGGVWTTGEDGRRSGMDFNGDVISGGGDPGFVLFCELAMLALETLPPEFTGTEMPIKKFILNEF